MPEQAAHLPHVGSAGLADRLRPEPHAVVRGDDDVGGRAVGAVGRLERPHEGLVLGPVDGLEVVPRRVVAHHVDAGRGGQFVLADREGHDGRGVGADARRPQAAGEGEPRIAGHGGQDHVGLGGRDPGHRRLDGGAAERDVGLADDRGADALEMVGDDRVDAARPDVVGSHEEELPRPEHVVAPLHRRRDLLVGCGSRVDDVGRLLDALVGHWIDEQVVGGLHDGQHALAAGARPASEDHAHLVVTDEPLGLPREGLPVARAIGDHPADRPAEQAAGTVDFLEREHLRVDHRVLTDGHRTGPRVEDAHDDRAAVDEQAVEDPPAGGRGRGQGGGDEPWAEGGAGAAVGWRLRGARGNRRQWRTGGMWMHAGGYVTACGGNRTPQSLPNFPGRATFRIGKKPSFPAPPTKSALPDPLARGDFGPLGMLGSTHVGRWRACRKSGISYGRSRRRHPRWIP